MEIAEQRESLGADSKDAKAEKKKKCCDNVEGCGRSFYIFVMFREVIEESNLN